MSRGAATPTLLALTAGPRAVVSPVRAFSTGHVGQRPFVTLLGMVALTSVCAATSDPVTVHLLRTTPGIGASPMMAKGFVLFQSLLLTPLGTAMYLIGVSAVVWALAMMFGQDITFKESTTVVCIAGVSGALKQLFVAAVLYVRWWSVPSSLATEITTGFDGFVTPRMADTFPLTILKHAGLFEIWFCVLLAIGLEVGVRLSRGSAIAVAVCTGLLLVSAKLSVSMLTGA